MTITDMLNNLINDQKQSRLAARYLNCNFSEVAGFEELSKIFLSAPPTEEKIETVFDNKILIADKGTGYYLINTIGGGGVNTTSNKVTAIKTYTTAPYKISNKSGTKILEDNVVKQVTADERSWFEVQVKKADGTFYPFRKDTNFVEGTYGIEFTITDDVIAANFGNSGKKTDAKINIVVPPIGSYIYYFTVFMNADGTQSWKDMKIVKTDGTPCLEQFDIISVPEEILNLPNYGEANPQNLSQYNYLDLRAQQYVKSGYLDNNIWVQTGKIITPIIFNPWFDIEKVEAIEFITSSNEPVLISFSFRKIREMDEQYHSIIVSWNDVSEIEGAEYTIYSDDQLIGTYSNTQSILLPKNANVRFVVTTTSHQSITLESSSGYDKTALETGWELVDNEFITCKIQKIVPENYYITAQVNNEEAYIRDGYTICVNSEEYRTSGSQVIPVKLGDNIKLYNNSLGGSEIYTYSHTIQPTPNYLEDGSWIADQDYMIILDAEKNPCVTITTSEKDEDRIESVKIFYRETSTDEWQNTYISKDTPFIGPVNCQYYIEAYTTTADYYIANKNLGSKDSPLILTEDINFNIVTAVHTVKVTINNPFSDVNSASDSIMLDISSYNNGDLKSDRITLDRYMGDVIYNVDIGSQFYMYIVEDSWAGDVYWDVTPADIVVDNGSFTALNDVGIYFTLTSG